MPDNPKRQTTEETREVYSVREDGDLELVPNWDPIDAHGVFVIKPVEGYGCWLDAVTVTVDKNDQSTWLDAKVVGNVRD